MGRFKGLNDIKTNQGGLYFKEGDYTVEILEVKMMQNRKRQDTFIIATRVEASTNDERAPGCQPSQVIVLKPEYLETALSNVKQFAAAMLGIDNPDSYVPEDGKDPDDFWDETLEWMVGPTQPMKGARIKLNCANILTKAGNEFTKHVWGPVISYPDSAADAS